MSDFYKITRLSITRRPERKSEKSYLWKDHLRGFEKGKSAFVPGDAFNVNLLVDFNDSVREGVIFELNIHDYDKKVTDDVRVRWFAKVLDVCGYRVLSQFIGTEKKFWIHLLSDDVFSVGHGAREMKDSVIYCPPLPINIAYQKDMERFVNTAIQEECEGHPHLTPIYDIAKTTMHTPRFRVGQRLELLNYQKSTEIRVARVQATCGRRINVLVMKKDFPLSSLPDAEDDRQVYHSGAQYWIDEGSFFIFPVGFAAVNGYTLNAKADYIEHTRKIAEAIKNHEEPKYDLDDVKFSDLPKQSVDPELWSKLKKGQKFELIDPLAQQFKNLHVASILDFLTTDGYLIVGMDGPDALEDSFPIHINNAFMFPVGYAKEHDLELVEPDEFEGEFEWKKYLEEQGAEPLPLELFRPEPSEERLDKFQVGMRLEAADMCENHFICPATITSVHGRILNVNFDGWDEEFDELYDIDSHDILPIGWCELHDYTLQEPRKAGSSP